MSVEFYYASGSPYAWRVWLALEYKSATYEQHVLSFDAGDLETPTFAKLNPRQKVPVLKDGKFVLTESSAIVEYVEERWPQVPRLFSLDVQQRARQRQLIREIDGYIAPAVEHLAEAVIYAPPEQRTEAAIGAAIAALQTELSRWEKAFGGEYLAGDPSAADFTLYPFIELVQRFAKRVPNTPADLLGPTLTAWAARMTALQVVQKTWPPHWK
ncbi:MAG: glutathione S-transferase family protein [Rhodospirillales bacterium]